MTMVIGISQKDGGIIVTDNNICKKYDRLGKYVGDMTLTARDLNSRQLFKAISVLTSNGETEVGVFDDGLSTRKGTADTMINLTMKGGFCRRLMQSGKQSNISYTQVIFLYSKDTEMGEYLQCI